MKYNLHFSTAFMIYLACIIFVGCSIFIFYSIDFNTIPFYLFLISAIFPCFSLYFIFVIASIQKAGCTSITIDKYDSKLILEDKNDGQVMVSYADIKNIEIQAGRVVKNTEIAKIKINTKGGKTYTCVISDYLDFTDNLPKTIEVLTKRNYLYRP